MKTNVLLAVDDKPDNLYVLHQIVAEYMPDCELAMATTAQQGLIDAAEGDFDGVLIDVQMPGIDGIEMCRRLKGDERTAHLPVVLITARESDARLRTEALRAGADDFLTKPIDNAELVAKLQVMLRIKRTEDGLRDVSTRLEKLVGERTRALEETSTRLQLALESANIGLWDRDLVTNDEYFSPQWLRQIGYEEGELPGRFEEWKRRLHPDDSRRVLDALEGYVAGREPEYSVEYRLRHKDGSYRWVLARGQVIRGEAGRPDRLLGCHVDITERKWAEDALRQYKHIVSSSPDMLALLDRDFVYIAANEAYRAAFGKTADELVGQKHMAREAFGEEFFEAVIRSHGERCLAGEDVRYQHWFDFPAYGRRYMDVAYSPYRESDGEIKGFVVGVRDLTERKRAQEALQESEQTMRAIFQAAGDGILLADGDTRRLVTGNEAICRMLGYTAEEIEDLSIADIHPAEGFPRVSAIFERQRRGEISLGTDMPVKRKDGTVFLADISTAPLQLHGRSHVVGVFRDITGRKRAEEALRESETRYRELFDHMGDGVVVYEPAADGTDFTVEDINKAGGRLSQRAKDDVVGRKITEAFPGIEESGLLDVLCQVNRTGRPQYYPEASYRHEGTVSWFENWVYKLPGGQIVTVYDDVTERKHAQEALQRDEERFRSVLEGSHDLISITDAAARTIWANPAWHAVFGKETEGGPSPFCHVHPDDKGRVSAAWEALVSENRSIRGMEYRFQLDGGEWATFVSNAFPLALEGEGRYCIMARDVTERKRAEEALRESQAQLRALAAATAQMEETERRRLARELHDRVGQVLTAMGINLSYVRDHVAESVSGDVADRVDRVLHDFEEAAEIIRDVMSELRPAVLDDYGLAAALRSYCRQYGERTGIATDVVAGESERRWRPQVETALFRIAQEALTNIARHADAQRASVTVEETGGSIRMVVSDDGKGFNATAAEISARRDGWGMITMRERALAVGGNCAVESEPGRGTRVIVEIREGADGNPGSVGG